MADAAAAASCAQCLCELYAPGTSAARRKELQELLQRERAAAADDAGLRALWRRVLLASSTTDELVLWFALSTAEASLRGPRSVAAARVPAAERAELKQALNTVLLGERGEVLPASAKNKGVQVLALLVRAAWPAEEPELLRELLSLLLQPGAPRALGGRLLAAVAECFGAADASQQAALVAFLPQAYAALSTALAADAEEGARAAAVPYTTVPCLAAARTLLTFGRIRSAAAGGGGGPHAARAFSADEGAALPALLGAACRHLIPTAAAAVAGARGVSGRQDAPVAALGLLSELCELKDAQTPRLLAPLVEPLVVATQRLAAEGVPAYGLDDEALDELEAALSYVLDLLCRSWLMHIAPQAAPLLLAALWAHSERSSARQLRRFVSLSATFLEGWRLSAEPSAASQPQPLIDGLLAIAPALLTRCLLSRSAAAARDFEDDAEERWAADAPPPSSTDPACLTAMWCSARDGGGDGAAAGAAGGGAGSDEEVDDDGDASRLESLLADTSRFLCELARWRPSQVVSLVAEALSATLHDLAAAEAAPPPLRLHVPYDVANLAALLSAALPAAAAAVGAPISELPVASLVQMLLTKLGPEPTPPPRSPYACRAELALLVALRQVCHVLSTAQQQVEATAAQCAAAVASPPASPSPSADAATAAVGDALASSVGALLSHALALLPTSAGGGAVCDGASAVLLDVTTSLWPPQVHSAGGLRRLAALGDGALGAHAASAAVPMSCWPRFFAAVVAARLVPPRGMRGTEEYRASHVPPAQIDALNALIDSLVAPLRSSDQPSHAADATDMRVGAPACCLSAVLTAMRDAPSEARAALDTAVLAAQLGEALQAQLGLLASSTPPPLGALWSLLRLLRVLTRSVAAGSPWSALAASQFSLRTALQCIGLVVSGGAPTGSAASSRAQREGLVEAALELVLASVGERSTGGADSAALVGDVLEICGPTKLGALLDVAGAGSGAPPPAEAAMSAQEASGVLTPSLREMLVAVVHALFVGHWKALAACDAWLSSALALVAAALRQPADGPTFRHSLKTVRLLHDKWAGGGTVRAVLAALGGGGDANGAGGGLPQPLQEMGTQLRCLVLAARLDPAHAPVHEEAAECLHAATAAEVRRQMNLRGDDGGGAAAPLRAESWRELTCAAVERCLRAEGAWLRADDAARLLGSLAATDVSDQPSFLAAIDRTAIELSGLRAEAAHEERALR